MHLLSILLLIVGVIVVMGAGVIGCSYALGRFFHAQEAGWPSAAAADRARFDADAEWYAGLPGWKQALAAGWWLTNRVLWAAKGYR